MASTLIGTSADGAVGIETVPWPHEAGCWYGLAASQVVRFAGTWLAWLTCCLGRMNQRARGPITRSTWMIFNIKAGQLSSARASQSLGVDVWS